MNAQSLGGAHLIESGNGIEKPDVVKIVAVVTIAEVRIEGVVIVGDVLFGVARADPGFLHRNALVFFVGRKLAFFGALNPVVAVVSDGADELFFGDFLHGEIQVVDEPILRSDRAGSAAGEVFIVVHDDNAIDRSRNSGVIEVGVANLHADVDLHSFGMEV